jgi:hypothetical protein
VRITELERALSGRAEPLAELSAEVEEMRSAAEAGRVAAAQVAEMALRADRAERVAAALEPELARSADAHAAELSRFEESLRERAQAIRLLEAEIARRDRMVHELVEALEESAAGTPVPQAHTAAPPPPPPPSPPQDDPLALENARLREKLDALALEVARREGEAQASAWAVAELERRVAEASAAAGGSSREGGMAPETAAPHRLSEVLDELDALRQAMAQEHALRVRVESGEELARARAEIQRQAVLLQQLGHPREPTETELQAPGQAPGK